MAGALWLVVDGYGARQVMAAGGGHWVAALVVSLPILVAVIWWLGMRRIAAWLAGRHDSPIAGWVLRYGLLALAVVLGAAAVWTGQTHSRAIRVARRALTTTAPDGVLPALSGPSAIESWCLLGLAGGLALLAVVTLGVALSRLGESDEAGAAGT